jgi:arylsulfatase A-like enzyme
MRNNILFIVMDTARFDIAMDPDVTPNLSNLREDSLTYTQAIANGPWTLPSHTSIFTGARTSKHQTHAGSYVLNDHFDLLPAILQREGYATAAISNNGWISQEFGFDNGFDKFVENWKILEGGESLIEVQKESTTIKQIKRLIQKLNSRSAHRTIINAFYMKFIDGLYDDGAYMTNFRAKQWWKSHLNENKFLFLNYLEPHLPYTPPNKYIEEFLPQNTTISDSKSVNQDPWDHICDVIQKDDSELSLLKSLYSAELRYLDQRIGELVKYLKKNGHYKHTNIVVVGDHGENIGEHGLMDHQYCLYDTLLHVPLLIKPAHNSQKVTINDLVELRDLFPTVLELAGIEQQFDDGISTNSILDGSDREYCISEYATPQPSMEALKEKVGEDISDSVAKYDRSLRSIRSKEYKLVESSRGECELFSLKDGESEDVSEREQPRLSELSSLLEDELGSFDYQTHSNGQEMSTSAKSRLEDLGYLQ